MKQPLGISLIAIAGLLLCALMIYALSPFPLIALLIVAIGTSNMVVLCGYGTGRVLSAIGYLVFLAFMVWAIVESVISLLEFESSYRKIREIVWFQVVMCIGCMVAAAYLFSNKANAYFRARREVGFAGSRKWIAGTAIAMLAGFLFFYDIFPRLMRWPVTVESAVERVIEKLSPSEQDALAYASDDQLIDYHFGLGMQIRNEFGLWSGNSRLHVAVCGLELCHPDDISGKIIDLARGSLRQRSTKPAK